MIRLIESTAGQTIYVSLQESVKHFTTAYDDYLLEFENANTNENFYVIGNVDSDNERYTSFDINTDSDDAVNGDIILKKGEYNYTIFGQNSTTNLNPTDAVVVGVLEIGLMRVTSTTTFFEEYDSVIVKDIVYEG